MNRRCHYAWLNFDVFFTGAINKLLKFAANRFLSHSVSIGDFRDN